jgi:hypothetical protein
MGVDSDDKFYLNPCLGSYDFIIEDILTDRIIINNECVTNPGLTLFIKIGGFTNKYMTDNKLYKYKNDELDYIPSCIIIKADAGLYYYTVADTTPDLYVARSGTKSTMIINTSGGIIGKSGYAIRE